MTIHDFSEALQEQGSPIQNAFARLKQAKLSEDLDPAGPDDSAAAWLPWT